jgi:pimeloyl-ACP methyl ester carboxylesterase
VRWLFVFCLAFSLNSAWAAEPEANIEDVAFKARCDGSEQRYVLRLPASFRDDVPHDVLIALHGHGSDRWQFVRDPRDECRAARDVAAKHGMIYASPDYRARTSWMGPKAEADVLQIIDELRQRFRVSRVFLCGGSMGGTAALTFAALHPELVAGVAAMNGTANLLEFEGFQQAISESFGGAKAALPAEYKRRSAEYWPERLTMPLGLSLGGEDKVVPPDSVRRLAGVLKRLGRDVLLIDRAETGHSTNYADGTAILEFAIEQAAKSSEGGTRSSKQ